MEGPDSTITFHCLSSDSFRDLDRSLQRGEEVSLVKHSMDWFTPGDALPYLAEFLNATLGWLGKSLFLPPNYLNAIDLDSEEFNRLSMAEQNQLFKKAPKTRYIPPDQLPPLVQALLQIPQADILAALDGASSQEGTNPALTFQALSDFLYRCTEIKGAYLVVA